MSHKLWCKKCLKVESPKLYCEVCGSDEVEVLESIDNATHLRNRERDQKRAEFWANMGIYELNAPVTDNIYVDDVATLRRIELTHGIDLGERILDSIRSGTNDFLDSCMENTTQTGDINCVTTTDSDFAKKQSRKLLQQ